MSWRSLEDLRTSVLNIMPKEISILTLNVNKGITEYKKQLKLKEYAKDFDVILLQETRGYKKSVLWKKYLGREGKFSFYRENARGAAALCRPHIQITQKMCDNNGRIAACILTDEGVQTAIISVYMPTLNNTIAAKSEYRETLDRLSEMVNNIKQQTKRIVIGGTSI